MSQLRTRLRDHGLTQLQAAGHLPLLTVAVGSHLYGTTLSTSDADWHGVFLPNPRHVLLQTAPSHLRLTTKTDLHAKSTAEDEEFLSTALHRWLTHLLTGQTTAIDLLFAPPDTWVCPNPWTRAVWTELVQHRHRCLSRGVSGFAQYCASQAAKYGIKGSRLHLLEHLLAFLATLPAQARLEEVQPEVTAFIQRATEEATQQGQAPHIRWTTRTAPTMQGTLPHSPTIPVLEVCQRAYGLRERIHHIQDALHGVQRRYGARAHAAAHDHGVDWKALMHAVRVTRQALELYTTGTITFPRPDRVELLAIRQGQYSFTHVSALLTEGMAQMTAAAAQSFLPETPDTTWADEFCAHTYYQHQQQTSCVPLERAS